MKERAVTLITACKYCDVRVSAWCRSYARRQGMSMATVKSIRACIWHVCSKLTAKPTQYIAMAEKAGIVELGGSNLMTWIRERGMMFFYLDFLPLVASGGAWWFRMRSGLPVLRCHILICIPGYPIRLCEGRLYRILYISADSDNPNVMINCGDLSMSSKAYRFKHQMLWW